MAEKSHRFYRYQHQKKRGWVSFQVGYRETDLWVRAEHRLEKETLSAVLNCRHQLEHYISHVPQFLHSLHPLPDDPWAPPLIRQMLQAAQETGVGPMAAVAGAIAQTVAGTLKQLSPSIIVENGGDCYLDLQEDITVGIYSGPHSPFKNQMALKFSSRRFPLSICTSSGSIGHSLSFGKADAVTVVAKDAALADAAATALGNLATATADVGKVLKRAPMIPSLEGVLIILKDKLGVWGDLELVPL